MSLRLRRWCLAGYLASLPLVHFACGSDEQRKFVDDKDGGGATAGTGGGSGSGTGGTGGSTADAGKTCSSDVDCDDGDPCSGEESCVSGRCQPGTPLADDTSCSVGSAGTADGSVDSVCIDGRCQFRCTQDIECDDGDLCTGTESCNPTTGTCQQGSPLACDDHDPCTQNECDPLLGCFFPLIDADKDGHAPTSLGSCGDDCDDSDETVYRGAQELCDNKDNNCNQQVDELAPTWYADCDGDGFAATGATSFQGCEPPAQAPPNCAGGSWVALAPGAGTTDCFDNDPNAHPFTAADNNSAWQDHPIAGAAVNLDFDYNCDGSEEPRYTQVNADKAGGCGPICLIGGGCIGCFGSTGYTGASAPSCGVSAEYTSCEGAGCTRSTRSLVQQCR